MFKVDELIKAAGAKKLSGSAKRITSVSGISIDTRSIEPGEAFVAIKGSNFDGHDFIPVAVSKGAVCIIRQPQQEVFFRANGVVMLEVKDTEKALGDIARFHRNKFDIPVIAVTGSNGKTTSKDMIAAVLSRKFNVLKNTGTKNNQIGLPLTLFGLKASSDFAVVELGSNHPGEIEYLAGIARPNIGVITNIGHSHLEHFKNLSGVLKEKHRLIERLISPHIAILNSDDSLLRIQATKRNRRGIVFSFGIRRKSDFSATQVKIRDEHTEFVVNSRHRFRLNTLGYYNVYNALAAVAVARIFGMGYDDIIPALTDFEFPASRLRLTRINDINFIDDTYNSNPLSLRQALDALEEFRVKGRKIFVMGDMLELGRRQRLFHRQAGYRVARVCDSFITVGKLSFLAAEAARQAGFNSRRIFNCETTQEARDILFNRISVNRKDIVLVKGSRSMRLEEIFQIK